MEIRPVEIKRLGTTGMSVRWSDGVTHELSSETLRRNCPCAVCREARGDESHAKPIGGAAAQGPKKGSLLKIVEHTLQEELELKQIWAVGNYAIGLTWGDGHDTGIYTFDYLHALAGEQKKMAVNR